MEPPAGAKGSPGPHGGFGTAMLASQSPRQPEPVEPPAGAKGEAPFMHQTPLQRRRARAAEKRAGIIRGTTPRRNTELGEAPLRRPAAEGP